MNKIQETLIFNTYDCSYYYSIVYNGKIYEKYKIDDNKAPKKIINLCKLHESIDDITPEIINYIKNKFKSIKTLIYSNNGSTIIINIRF